LLLLEFKVAGTAVITVVVAVLVEVVL